MNLAELELATRAAVDAVADDPNARYALRDTWYRKWGFPELSGGEGFGRAELDFLAWEVRRGALAPLTAAAPGSPWWRAVQSDFAYTAELAGRCRDAGLGRADLPAGVLRWYDYFDAPDAKTWYRAHNHNIIQGYLDRRRDALAESRSERVFLNQVLYRLVFAHALVEDKVGELGVIAADPRLFSVAFITSLDALYPEHYPLDSREVGDVRHLGRGLEEVAARVLDEQLILPNLDRLYSWEAELVGQPTLVGMMVVDNKGVARPIYPRNTLARITPPSGKKQRVLILGGGMAGLTAAWSLTNQPGASDLFDITLVQTGWRCGGKTATGRGPNARVEERGLHILQGWYDNAFRLFREVYAERTARQLDPDSPFAGWEDALVRNDATNLTEYLPKRNGWVNWPLVFPRNHCTPGDYEDVSTWDKIREMVLLALELALGSPWGQLIDPSAQWILDRISGGDDEATEPTRNTWFGRAAAAVEAGVEAVTSTIATALAPVARAVTHKLLTLAQEVLRDVHRVDEEGATSRSRILDVLDTVLAPLRNAAKDAADTVLAEHDDLRHTLILLELARANVEALICDVWEPQDGKFHFDRIEGIDYRAWLHKYDCADFAVNSVIVDFFYKGTFANLYGEEQDGGKLAASSAVQFVLASTGYKGSFVWQFRAGTGDTLVMPLWQVLKARGVKFEFFRTVEAVEADDNGRVARVRIARQVDLAGDSYDPTIRVGGVTAWPLHPNYDQINAAQAAELQARNINLENPWSGWQPVSRYDLVDGADFDQVILAIPVAALKPICGSLIARDPRWGLMVDRVCTTQTMAAQLYLLPTLAELGWHNRDWGLPDECAAPNLVTYAPPMYSWVDSSQTVPFEQWPKDNTPQVVTLFCGAMADGPAIPAFDSGVDYEAKAIDVVRSLMHQWLADNMAWCFPDAAPLGFPSGLDLKLLADACNRPDATRNQRYASQFYWANVAPDRRYTLSVPGTGPYRLRADESGFANLYLAGDWIDFGLNVGYIEGTVISGMQAAHAVILGVLGLDPSDPIYGASDVASLV